MTAILALGCGDFAVGGGGGTVSISNLTVSKTVIGSAATAAYRIDNDGTVKNHDLTTLETWLISGLASDYEVRATLTSGTTPTAGTMGSWLNCGTDRTWSNTDNTANGVSVTSTMLIEIRDVATSTVQDNASVTVEAERDV